MKPGSALDPWALTGGNEGQHGDCELSTSALRRARGFHTGTLTEAGELRLHYVYDCGAMTRYAAERQREIKRYIKGVGVGTAIDLLFISHAHADHLNGLEQLLDSKAGLEVDMIVLPLLNVADRLIAFARTRAEDPASAQNSFYRAFGVDPGGGAAALRPREDHLRGTGRS